MPRRKSVNQHGTQGGQQTITEKYKILKNFKELAIQYDPISFELSNIYQKNIWGLREQFQSLGEYYEQIGKEPAIAWNEGIQYIDLTKAVKIRDVSLSAFRRGDYKAVAIDGKPNDISTEAKYAQRIVFYTKTFPPFKQYQDNDNFSWLLLNNRLLSLCILDYHNQKGNSIESVNNDFKAIIRAIKVILQDPDHEIRWKFSALQIALGDIDRFSNDLNEIQTKREVLSFIPYEQLLDITDALEAKYLQELSKLPVSSQSDGKSHPDSLFHLHQQMIAVAINVWDYPSRLDKYDMKIITDKSQIQPDNNYLELGNMITLIFNNDKKHHKPLSYKLNAKPILQLNKRLNKLLLYSFQMYPRDTLFIAKNSWANRKLTPVSDTTVSSYIVDLVPNKSLGVGTFRSSFVSYYYNKSNNREKEIMRIRMRTSRSELERAYLKFYNTPEQLIKVKIEPTDDLIARAKSGKENSPIVVGDDTGVSQVRHSNNIHLNIQLNQPRMNIHERRRQNAKEWYKKNGEHHREKVKENNMKPETARKRIIRELNNGLQTFNKLRQSTIDKYNIQVGANGSYS